MEAKLHAISGLARSGTEGTPGLARHATVGGRRFSIILG
jgi:hypothetical protein